MTSRMKLAGIGVATALAFGTMATGALFAVQYTAAGRAVGAFAHAMTDVTVYAAGQNPGGPPPFGRGGPGRFGGPGGPGPGGGPAGIALDRLNLSDAQKDQVKQILQSHQADTQSLVQREMAARQALEDAVSGDAFDEGAVRARSADLASVEADLAVSRARIRSEVFQVLTPDQQAQVRQMQADAKQRQQQMQQRRGRRNG